MKAPDKIFLRETTRVNDTWYQKPSNLCQNHEYIRKDAILEWARSKMTIEGATEGIVGGYDLALKDLVKHIESL